MMLNWSMKKVVYPFDWRLETCVDSRYFGPPAITGNSLALANEWLPLPCSRHYHALSYTLLLFKKALSMSSISCRYVQSMPTCSRLWWISGAHSWRTKPLSVRAPPVLDITDTAYTSRCWHGPSRGSFSFPTWDLLNCHGLELSFI